MTKYLILLSVVILGYLFVIFTSKKNNNIDFLLAFSGAFLLSTVFIHILPDVYKRGELYGVWIVLGIFVQILLDSLSKGIEHGHHHGHKISKVMFIGFFIHAFLEGFPLEGNHNLLTAIAIHKLPITIALSTFLLSSNLDKKWILLTIILFAIMTPLGSFVGQNDFLNLYKPQITALVSGILLHVSTTILWENNKNHSFNLKKLFVILLGFVISFAL